MAYIYENEQGEIIDFELESFEELQELAELILKDSFS